MSRQDQIINERKRKLQELRKITNPYPHKFNQKDFSRDIKQKHEKLNLNQKSKSKAQIAGRVMTIRNLGKLIFTTIQDSEGKIQLILQKSHTSDKDFELFKKYIDIG